MKLPTLARDATRGLHPCHRALGHSRLVASLPFPGYPEGIAVYVCGPAAFRVPGNFQPSKISIYDVKMGALVDTITI